MVGDVFPKTIALVVVNGPRRQVALLLRPVVRGWSKEARSYRVWQWLKDGDKLSDAESSCIDCCLLSMVAVPWDRCKNITFDFMES